MFRSFCPELPNSSSAVLIDDVEIYPEAPTGGKQLVTAGEIPGYWDLAQNYPNRFSSGARSSPAGNPSTAIEFALPKTSFVTLKIYDLLGKEVATLVAEKLPAGKHQRVWEAKGLASGVYLYRLEAGEFIQTKKLILLR